MGLGLVRGYPRLEWEEATLVGILWSGWRDVEIE